MLAVLAVLAATAVWVHHQLGIDGTPGIDWGAAMRAELAAIDVPRERWRSALGCVWASLRMGLRRGPVFVAATIGVALGLILLNSSRQAMGSGGSAAPLWGVLALVVPVLLVICPVSGVGPPLASCVWVRCARGGT